MKTEQIASLIAAVEAGNREEAGSILAANPAITGADIFVAASMADADAVDRLLAADPSLAVASGGPHNFQPLLYLAYSRVHAMWPQREEACERVARALLAHGADPDTTHAGDWDGAPPLSALYAATGVTNNPRVARILLEAGANPNDGESVYHAAEANNRECLELLALHGAELSARCEPWGNTPLYFLFGYRSLHPHVAIATEGARWLLEHGADPNVTSYDIGETPLHLAVRLGRSAEDVAMLLDHGADPNARRKDGRTPYSLAVRCGHPELVRLLAGRGAAEEPTLIDYFVGAAARADEDTVREMLLENPGLLRLLDDEDRSLIVEAATMNRVATVRLLLNVGFDIAATGEAGATALHASAWRGHRSLVELLLDRGAPIDVRCRAYNGTPLDWAVHGSTNWGQAPQSEYVAIVEAIIAAGADPGSTNAEMGSPEVAAVLERRIG
ncbi:MAG TPA: ankyrin repeat domain-containing protein [Candidatus Kapabacteria bacterium]|nr:ankyrin repeat domain-containing protein [Candidatus Kapabacteria bacterium]